MSFKRVVKYSATNTAAATLKIKDTMIAAGWVLHDDQSGASKYYILYSDGEDSDQMRVYLKLDWVITNYISFKMYLYWNNTTHVGIVEMYSSSYSRITSDDDASFYIWIYCDKNSVCIIDYVLTWDGMLCSKLTLFNTLEGTLQSSVTAGSNVVLTLAAGEANQFRENCSYQIVGATGEGRDRVLINNVNRSANQITIASLLRDYNLNSRIGYMPWPWICGSVDSNFYIIHLKYNSVGTTNNADTMTPIVLISDSYVDPDQRSGEYVLVPYYFCDGAYTAPGYIDNYVMRINGGIPEDIATSGEVEWGTSSGSNTSTTLNDTTKSWATNEWQNKCLAIISGTGEGQIRKINSNTATALTVDEAWIVTPDATSEYIICIHGWRIFFSSSNRKAFREV